MKRLIVLTVLMIASSVLAACKRPSVEIPSEWGAFSTELAMRTPTATFAPRATASATSPPTPALTDFGEEYANWEEAQQAVPWVIAQGLIQPCQTDPPRFCPEAPLDRNTLETALGGIVQGNPFQSLFTEEPPLEVSRGELSAWSVVLNLGQQYEPPDIEDEWSNMFYDVPPSHTFALYIYDATRRGLWPVELNPQYQFFPDEPGTRTQFAVILWLTRGQ